MSQLSIGPVCRVLGVLFLAALAGCAGKPAAEREAVPAAEAAAGTPDPNQALNDLGSRLRQAQANQVDLLSPENFRQAREAYNEAKQIRSESKEAFDPAILEKTNEGQAHLNQALKTAEISRASLAQAQEARNLAIKAGARKDFPEEFKEADRHFLSVTEDVEDGDVATATREGPKLLAEYNKLEKKAVREEYASESANLIRQAKSEGAEKWAPKTLAKTQAQFGRLDATINGNPRAIERISDMAAKTYDDAEFLLSVTRQSKTLEAKGPEERALGVEEMREDVAISQAAAMRSKEEQMAKAQELESAQQQLKGVKRLEAVAQAFSPDEAEVVRKEDKLVIRLKALDFPTSKAQIQSEDYALLNKVGDVLEQTSPEAKVTIQGNTDSTGGRKLNQKLSEKRAEAVKDYLVSAQSIPSEQIKSKGVGYSQPIASNKTEEGRKLNRRVDVIIEEKATS